ncbi:hypothetical protein KEM48_010160 [Puccinia striiformis f. sp. tritici PST-130]|nr:hypothetical protein KEM48_010160 [Puccinia striiformis f. sp. tritici PST-130]
MVEPTSSPELISRGQIEFSVRYCSPKESVGDSVAKERRFTWRIPIHPLPGTSATSLLAPGSQHLFPIMSVQQGLPLIHDRYDYVAYILPGFVTGVYASACFGGMVISEGIRVLYRFPQDSTLMRAMVLWVMGCSLLHTRFVGEGHNSFPQNSTTNSNWTSNSWFEYIAYHYAVDGFHDVRLLNM